jgi:hypothetical protein
MATALVETIGDGPDRSVTLDGVGQIRRLQRGKFIGVKFQRRRGEGVIDVADLGCSDDGGHDRRLME